VLPWISRGVILHVSSHARVSMHDPWSSAFLLGKGDDEDAWLSAREVASRRRPARLAVLASCRSSLDRGFNNESVLGLARAFLAAGVPSVLATLWPVDDQATVAFTRRFYLGLEQGRTAADALRQAQAETRRVPATSAPYYWAGFTLSGDPDTRVRPQRRH
jgi:CHAT domain-containing protein